MKYFESIKHTFAWMSLFFLILFLAHCGQESGISSEESISQESNSAPTSPDSEISSRNPEGSLKFRSIDGIGNNVENPLWGSAGSRLQRLGPPSYADGVSSPAGEDRPNPREISNALLAQEDSIPNNRRLSSFMFAWGQFLDHDLDLSLTDTNQALPISIPSGDPFFDPLGSGTVVIPFSRSVSDPTSGSDANNPRQQTNVLTAWIDASQVYGSDDARAAWLRTGAGGRLKTSEGNLLPFNDGSQINGPSSDSNFFVAGDLRANETVFLMTLHTLLLREHNRLAGEIEKAHEDWTDEQIYQEARRWVGALMQSITYNEFLPALLGPHAPGAYRGYDPTVNPSIFNEFSTAFFRVGHTMLTDELKRIDDQGNEWEGGALSLQDSFFNPTVIVEDGIEPILRGLYYQAMQEVDNHVVDGVRNFLFGPPGAGGLDLASLNLQRGRDHGLPDYNTLRFSVGLKRIQSFSELSSKLELQSTFQQVYGSVDLVDPWIGALSEDHLSGASVGPLITKALNLQFEALRRSDRFWYENDPAFSHEDRERIRKAKLSHIIRRNTGIQNIPEDVFRVYKSETK